ncbi:hypothetical protein [Cerasicoccus fimbriatus]|uniref:hypothetical protein n=1 Tax=Cerasicoccus fimbriatus TaxID=3014554 RepID=UPI0022B4108D|nr:hypothetical protein [Cerasicoccus sp. TK19100]
MKLLTPAQIDFSQAKLLSSAKAPRRLFRLGGDQYLVVSYDATNVMLGVDSPDLSSVIGDLRSDIVDVELSTIRPLLCRDHARVGTQEIEVRLYTKRGDIYVINPFDGIIVLDEP